ncbi:MAG TPA: hypothetical protein VFZ52_01520 [Chryseolinea sp.]
MRKIILVTCVLLMGISGVHGAKEKKPVQAVWRMDIYYFKVAKEFLGANMEIYSADGVKLLSQKVERRKVLVDFYYEDPGRYIIHFVKGDAMHEFSFVKNSECPEAEKPQSLITVIQGV